VKKYKFKIILCKSMLQNTPDIILLIFVNREKCDQHNFVDYCIFFFYFIIIIKDFKDEIGVVVARLEHLKDCKNTTNYVKF